MSGVQPGDQVIVYGTVIEAGSEMVIMDVGGHGLAAVPLAGVQILTAPAGGMHEVEPVDPAEVATTRAMVKQAVLDYARNLHEHAHGGNGEFGECTRDTCVDARAWLP